MWRRSIGAPRARDGGRRFEVKVLRPSQERDVPWTRLSTDIERKTSLVGFFGFWEMTGVIPGLLIEVGSVLPVKAAGAWELKAGCSPGRFWLEKR